MADGNETAKHQSIKRIVVLVDVVFRAYRRYARGASYEFQVN